MDEQTRLRFWGLYNLADEFGDELGSLSKIAKEKLSLLIKKSFFLQPQIFQSFNFNCILLRFYFLINPILTHPVHHFYENSNFKISSHSVYLKYYFYHITDPSSLFILSLWMWATLNYQSLSHLRLIYPWSFLTIRVRV